MRVFITGAANGIGKAAALQLLDCDHEVIAYDIDAAGLDDLPDEITTYEGDVYDEERVKDVFEQETFDVLVNDAGYQARGTVEDQAAETVEKHFETNLFGMMHCIRHALPMLRERDGRIINISSMAGKVTGPTWGAYAASKHAVEAMSDILRMELLETDVDVVIVEPGGVKTGFNERGRDFMQRYLPESFYADMYETMLEGKMGGVDPERAGFVVRWAAESNHLKARYTVTWQARLYPFLKQLFPTWLWDRLAALAERR